MKLLFQADLRGEHPSELLASVQAHPDAVALLDYSGDPGDERPAAASEPLDELTRRLVTGVGEHRDQLDATIGRFARRWSVSRMPVIDRNLLRLAAYELRFEDTAPAIVIDEAVSLAKALSTDDSGRFVNGVLEAIRRSLDDD